MSYKFIFSDLDGTLLNSKHEISDYSSNIIKKSTQNGVKFCIATGRHYLDTLHYYKELGENIFLITSNGARIHDPNGKLIFKKNMDRQLIIEILNSNIISKDIHINFYHEEGWILFKENQDVESFIIHNNFYPKKIKKDSLKNYDIIKMILYCKNPINLEKLENYIIKTYNTEFEVYFSSKNSLEITASGVTKGNAMQLLLNHESILPSQTLAFGDGLNDLDMLKKAGKSLIMKDAHIRLKKLLSHKEIIGGCNEDSVAKYINSLEFNNKNKEKK